MPWPPCRSDALASFGVATGMCGAGGHPDLSDPDCVSGADIASSTRGLASRKRLVARGFLVNTSNPKAIAFFLAALCQFLDPTRSLLTQYLWLTLTMVVDSIVMAGYTGLASQALLALKSPRQQKPVNRIFGALFMGAAGLLASVHR